MPGASVYEPEPIRETLASDSPMMPASALFETTEIPGGAKDCLGQHRTLGDRLATERLDGN